MRSMLTAVLAMTGMLRQYANFNRDYRINVNALVLWMLLI